MNACETKVTLEEMRIYGHQRSNNLDVFNEHLANMTAKDKMAGYAGKYVSWDSFQLLILEKRLHEHMNRMERTIDPEATRKSVERSVANIRSLEQSVASAAEIGVSIKPILAALEALNARMVALENRPQPQQGCCVVS